MGQPTPELRELKERLRRLERQNRMIKRVGIALLVVTCGLLAMAQAGPRGNVVEASGFIVVDKEGNKRISLGVEPTGASCIRLHGAAADTRASLCLTPDRGPYLLLMKENKVTFAAP